MIFFLSVIPVWCCMFLCHGNIFYCGCEKPLEVHVLTLRITHILEQWYRALFWFQLHMFRTSFHCTPHIVRFCLCHASFFNILLFFMGNRNAKPSPPLQFWGWNVGCASRRRNGPKGWVSGSPYSSPGRPLIMCPIIVIIMYLYYHYIARSSSSTAMGLLPPLPGSIWLVCWSALICSNPAVSFPSITVRFVIPYCVLQPWNNYIWESRGEENDFLCLDEAAWSDNNRSKQVQMHPLFQRMGPAQSTHRAHAKYTQHMHTTHNT